MHTPIVRIKDEVAIDDQFFRRRVIWVSVADILGLISLANWFSLGLWAQQASHVVLWWLVAFCSALLLCGMGVIRHVTYNQLSEREQKSVRILDHSGLQSFLRSQAEKGRSQTAADTVYVPTGVFIQSMEISGPNEVFAKGYVWQKLAKDLPAETSRGLILPDAVQVNLSEAYRRDQDGVETVGWYFEARIRQDFNLSRYPFDHEAVSLRLWTKNFDTGVVPSARLGLLHLNQSYVQARVERGPGNAGLAYFPGHFLITSSVITEVTSAWPDLGGESRSPI